MVSSAIFGKTLYLCKQKLMLTKSQRTFIDRLRRRIGKTILRHELINDGDRVLVGVSGGKDSLILLDALTSKRTGLPIKFDVVAVHIAVKNVLYEADTEFIENFCKERNIEFHLREIELDFSRDPKVSPCFVCSWNRRAELFKLTNTLNCNKLALGHHMDDLIETLILNMAFNAEISALPYKVKMFKGRFEIIRPLLNIEEKDLTKYAKLTGLDNKELKQCNFSKDSKRQLAKNIIKQLEAVNPKVRLNLFRSTNKIVEEYLPKLEGYEQHRRNRRTS